MKKWVNKHPFFLWLQSESHWQFHDEGLLRIGDGLKRRIHQNVETPSQRGTSLVEFMSICVETIYFCQQGPLNTNFCNDCIF